MKKGMVKKGWLGLVVSLGLLVSVVGGSHASTFTFSPVDYKKQDNTYNDMLDLDHYYVYSWKINWNKPSNATIVDAKMIIKDIYDWRYENNDILRINLLDNPPALSTQIGNNLWWKSDKEFPSNYWAGNPLVGEWSDPYGDSAHKTTLVFTLPAQSSTHADLEDLTAYVADGVFGFGFDPDCHYYNNGITFEITTVPEPSVLVLLGSGLVGVGILGRRKRAY